SDSSELIRRLNQEAAKSVMYCGMDEVDALALATINPAKQLKIDDRVGSLKPGKDGDFVIWSDHPLSIYAVAEQTWIDGTPYFTIEKDLELREKLRKEKSALVQKVLRSGRGKIEENESGESTPEPERPEWGCDTVVDVWAARGGAR
ncbi:MAG: amidohydrolase family protein, partial [Thermoanaerobaculia bacterium]|nr:amidohydrolase family protein [Thermoanaerobaculia bacterium]